jgi:phospholipid/cholesterol/gamma-HCH transport system substrate-binding protein
MKRSAIETIMGAVVLLVAGLFLVFAYQSTDLRLGSSYQLTARFNAVDGLTLGSDVRVGGVKVGSVIDQGIDEEIYQAVITLAVRRDVGLPADSKAVIASDGLLGGRYVKIEPGTAGEMLADGDRIERTEDAIALEELLGKVMFLVTGEEVE